MVIEDKTLVDAYAELGSANKVSKRLGIPSSTVSYRLKKLGVLRRWKKQISDRELIDNYLLLQSVRKVGELFGISHETARYKLKKLGALNKPIVYQWNDCYFDIDSEESFYWAGFIAADGCVKIKDKKYKQLSIGLAQKDHEHLCKFKKCISFTGPVHKINGLVKKSEVTISSAKMFDDLSRFNIVPRKTLVYEFPEWLVSHPNVNHFMRGYFDGDGSFYTTLGKNKNTKQLYFSLRGTKKFLITFRDILDNHCATQKGKRPRLSNGIYLLEYGGNLVVKSIADFLYSNCEIALDRKLNVVFGEQ